MYGSVTGPVLEVRLAPGSANQGLRQFRCHFWRSRRGSSLLRCGFGQYSQLRAWWRET